MSGKTRTCGVGERLRALRAAAGLSQDALAQQMASHDWIQTTVSKVELGERTVDALEAISLARVLGAPLDWAAA